MNGQTPPDPGQPILDGTEQQTLANFWTNFGADVQSQDQQSMQQYNQDLSTQMAHFVQGMPQTYVGSDTALRSPMEWHAPMNGMSYDQNAPSAIGHPISPFDQNAQHIMSNNGLFMNDFNHNWQQQFSGSQQHPPAIQFGSDPQFMSSHYATQNANLNHPNPLLASYNMTHAASNPHSSTHPASSDIPKKRNFDVYAKEGRADPNGQQMKYPAPPTEPQQKRRSFVKHDSSHSISKVPSPQEVVGRHDDDAEAEPEDYIDYEEAIEDGPSRSDSPPAPWPSSKSRPQKNDHPVPPNRSKRKSASTPTRTKLRRSSSNMLTGGVSRTPLTAEQKKMNHTNSEQRRRDATAKSYAELYDLVPEIHDGGKLSTMKKLEVVVDKVRAVKQRLEDLRLQLGRDPATGQPVPHLVAALPQERHIMGSGMAHLAGWR